VTPARRLAVRLAFGLIAGLIAGLILGAVSALEVYIKVLPLGFLYGLGLGLATPGIIGGLELAERELKQLVKPL
jgi:hypothetical protein